MKRFKTPIFSFFVLSMLLVCSMFYSSCQKDDSVVMTVLSVTDEQITPSYASATLTCRMQSNNKVLNPMVVYSTTSDFSQSSKAALTLTDASDGAYTATLSDLSEQTTYFVRYQISNAVSTILASYTGSFTTTQYVKPEDPYSMPVVSTGYVSDISSTQCTLHGVLLSNGNDSTCVKGFCWSTDSMPTLDDTFVEVSTFKAAYSYQLTQLQPSTSYHMRPYAKNRAGIAYGGDTSFTTAAP